MAITDKAVCPDMTKTPLFYIRNRDLVPAQQFPDIVVTQDYGLSAMVLSKGGKPITQNGLIINDSNLTMLLTTRHESKKARMSGAHLKGPKKRTNENDKAFIDSLNKLLND